MAGQTYNGIPVSLVASAVKSASGNSGSLKNTSTPIPTFQAAAFILDVTASSSPTTLDVLIETSVDNGTTWYLAWEFTQIGAVSTAQRRLDVRSTGIGITEVGADTSIANTNNPVHGNTVVTQDLRVRWIVAGTSYTFAVWGIFQPFATNW